MRARLFQDRAEAGRRLADRLLGYADAPGLVVLALPRGGVPVGFEVAAGLRAPLDVFVVRKLGAPGHEELAMGAIASGGVRVLNDEVIDALGIHPADVDAAAAREALELERRERLYRGDAAPLRLDGRTVILVDDGLATGSTMRAAVAGIHLQKPARLIVAVPVGAVESCQLVAAEVDELVCLSTPEPFNAVGLWYERFGQTSDEEVRALLERNAAARSSTA